MQAQGQSGQAYLSLLSENQVLLRELHADRLRGQEERENRDHMIREQRDTGLAMRHELNRLRAEQAEDRVAMQLELDAAVAQMTATADPCPEPETDDGGILDFPSPATERGRLQWEIRSWRQRCPNRLDYRLGISRTRSS